MEPCARVEWGLNGVYLQVYFGFTSGLPFQPLLNESIEAKPQHNTKEPTRLLATSVGTLLQYNPEAPQSLQQREVERSEHKANLADKGHGPGKRSTAFRSETTSKLNIKRLRS